MDLWGGYYRFFFFDFFGNFYLDSMRNLLEVLRFFPLLNLGGKKFWKKIFRLAVTWPQKCNSKPPINLITIVKMSSYIPLRPIFAKLGTLIHFVVNSNLEKIWVDSEILVRVMTSSILKCGSWPPLNLFSREICLLFFRIFEKRTNIVPVDWFAWKFVCTV